MREGDVVILAPEGRCGRTPGLAARGDRPGPQSRLTADGREQPDDSTVSISTERFNDLPDPRHQRGARAGEVPFGSASAPGRIHRDGFADRLFCRCS